MPCSDTSKWCQRCQDAFLAADPSVITFWAGEDVTDPFQQMDGTNKKSE
jgi:hypothetical protein